MMRKFKFRIWDNKNNSWFKTKNPWNLLGECVLLGGLLFEIDLMDNDHLVVEQFTGLYDQNGKEIYEGDIINIYIDNEVFTRAVIFDKGCFLYERLKTSGASLFGIAPICEVVGNIHEEINVDAV